MLAKEDFFMAFPDARLGGMERVRIAGQSALRGGPGNLRWLMDHGLTPRAERLAVVAIPKAGAFELSATAVLRPEELLHWRSGELLGNGHRLLTQERRYAARR